ncbi:MAG: hypothetical protein ABS863_00435 [Aerococcus urinaeequi]
MLVLDIPHVSISSLQKSTKPMIENEVVCVMKNYVPAFYTINPKKMSEIISNKDSTEAKYPAFCSQLVKKCLNDLEVACLENNAKFNSILVHALSSAIKELKQGE